VSESTAAISLKRFRVPENLRGLAACAVLFAIMAATTEGMASAENLRSIGTAAIPLFLLALGQMAVMISGGIDLSVTATMALSSITGAVVMRETGSSAAGVTAMLAVGAGIGFINGAAVAWLRLPPFMVTLTTQCFCQGWRCGPCSQRTSAAFPRVSCDSGRKPASQRASQWFAVCWDTCC
jgi:ribose/xylose/arabinose/galactoside ABC-type transport system permease subunit